MGRSLENVQLSPRCVLSQSSYSICVFFLFCFFMAYLPRLALPGVTLTQFVTFLVVNNGNSFRAGFEVVLPPFFPFQLCSLEWSFSRPFHAMVVTVILQAIPGLHLWGATGLFFFSLFVLLISCFGNSFLCIVIDNVSSGNDGPLVDQCVERFLNV